MLTDLYGLEISTDSAAAAEAYRCGQAAFLTAETDPIPAFFRATEEDPGFALAHIAIARNHQMFARKGPMKEALAAANAAPVPRTDRERAHLAAFTDLLEGRVPDGYARIRAHLRDHPRDALIAQTCLGVFSLIGFSGLPGREAEHLALAEALAPAYGDDPWFRAQLAFAQLEAGQLAEAAPNIEASIAAQPRSAHGAHIRAHLHYECGEAGAGRAYLEDWMTGYDRTGLMHCHNAWHVALWALETGDEEAMWRTVDDALDPALSQSPPINVLTDQVALFYRAELAGLEVPAERWNKVSDYALECFPKPGLAFVDIHAALAHARAGVSAAREKIETGARGPAAEMVAATARAFGALADRNWSAVVDTLTPVLSDHARLGGSRAQRDLLDYTMLLALLKLDRRDEALRLLAIRRPVAGHAHAVAGLVA